jgi:hypothetical protein
MTVPVKLWGGGLAQYIHQLMQAERQLRDEVARIVREAEARGAKVTFVGDEIYVDEPGANER